MYIAAHAGTENTEDCRVPRKSHKEFAVAPQPSIAASIGSGLLSKL